MILIFLFLVPSQLDVVERLLVLLLFEPLRAHARVVDEVLHPRIDFQVPTVPRKGFGSADCDTI